MNEVFQNALSVFIGIMMVIIVLWVITTIMCLIFQDKFFSKEKQEQFRNDISNYMSRKKGIKENKEVAEEV
jgi:uncharacterized membrane protein (DUF106 family)